MNSGCGVFGVKCYQGRESDRDVCFRRETQGERKPFCNRFILAEIDFEVLNVKVARKIGQSAVLPGILRGEKTRIKNGHR